MENKDDLLELSVYEQGRETIDELIDVEIDTIGSIIENAEEIPYAGSLLKFCKAGLGFINIWFLRKIARFIKASAIVSDVEKEQFLKNLSSKDKTRISCYLTNLLYVTEEERKAEIMGKIYAARVRNKINNEMMLRLCSTVNGVFIFDLDTLYKYREESDYDGYMTDNLFGSGLLEQLSSNKTEKVPGKSYYSMSIGLKRYKLNEIGEILCKILSDDI